MPRAPLRCDRTPRPNVRPKLLTPLIVACALFMENLDSTVLSTSLPAIAVDLHQDPIALKLALTSYLLSLAIFIPASGWAADRFGARTIFRSAIVVFTAGSILCGLSSTLPGFVAARVFQGLGGAMMVPVGRLVLLRSVPREEVVGALAYLTIPALVGPILGPPLGGFITTYFHWRWIFWINVPIGVLGVTLATLFIPNVREEKPWPLDKVGFLLSGLGLSATMFGLTVAGRGFLSIPLNAALILAGVVLVVAYIIHARRTAYPIIDLKLLAIPTFRASVAGGFLFRLGIGALPFLLPLLLQLGIGMTPFRSGCLTLASAAGAMAMKTSAQRILRRFGFRQVLAFNALISSLFMVVYGTFGASTPMIVIFVLLLAGGFFRSLEFTGINAIAYADIDNAAMSRATSFASVAQQLSISTGVAVGAGVIELSQISHGDTVLRLQDFGAAFFVVAAISATSIFVFLGLKPDAGAAMSGHKASGYAPATAESLSGAPGEALPRNPVART